ncbi:MAG: hypothetical protein KF893_19635 [Caldilineaceae bacterium]|nr:hypothetical protein [Caldilineaceae bacterium]
MESTQQVVEQIKELVAPLSPEERLRVIRAISGMPKSPSSSDPSAEEMLADQEWWFTLPIHVRKQYQGEHVAIYKGAVVDHDHDVRSLHRRIRQKYGSAHLLVLNADWKEMPIYTFPGFQLER